MRLAFLLAPPLTWLVVAYLGSLAVLLVSAFWSTDEFTGAVVRAFTVDNIVRVLTDEVFRIATLRTLAVAATVTVCCAALAVPLAVLVARSLKGPYYQALLQDDRVVGSPLAAIRNSLLFAVVAMVLATVIGLLAATVISWRRGRLARWFDLTLMLPLGTSAVTIGFGFIVALDAPVDLRASIWLVPIAHALVAIPFVVRSTVPTLRSIPAQIREAAAVLGASPWRVWWSIDLPIVTRAALVGAGFAFVISLGEFGATSFVARPNTTTIPVMIFRLLSRPGQTSFGMAMAEDCTWKPWSSMSSRPEVPGPAKSPSQRQ